MKLYLNLNENIKVKINDRGYQYLAEQNNKIMTSLPHNRLAKNADDFRRKADKEGYTKMQMWRFIELFGPVTIIGFQTYYDPTILIETTY